jgi:hypothetical protein
MDIPGFAKTVGEHATSKTTWGAIAVIGLAVYAFFEGRIEWPAMMESLAMGFGILGISDRMGK